MRKLTLEDASSTFAATLPRESLGCMLSRCSTRASRQALDVKVSKFYDIRTHIHNKARRSILKKVPREDHECKSGNVVLGIAMYGTRGLQYSAST